MSGTCPCTTTPGCAASIVISSGTSPPMQWKRTAGKRARMSGNTADTNHCTASALGGCRKPPTKTMSWRCANGRPGPATWCRLDSTSTRACGASCASNARSGALGGAQQRGVGGELGTAAFAQVMQVDTVEHHPGPWGVLAQHRQEVAG